MYILALIVGLLVVFGLGVSLGDLVLGVMGVGAALLMLAIVIDTIAGILEWIGRHWAGMHHDSPIRLHQRRSAL